MAECLDDKPEEISESWTPGGRVHVCFGDIPTSFNPLPSRDRVEGGGKMTTSRRKAAGGRVHAGGYKSFSSGSEFLKERKLRMAALSSNFVQAKSLLEEGIDARAADDHGRTALHFAASKGNVDMVSLLIVYGADVNQRDRIGNTALHLAACTGHIDVVTVLLQAGTDVNAEDMAGHTPLQLARSRLRLLTEDSFLRATPFRLQHEIAQIVELLKAYLHRTGDMESEKQVVALAERLATSREEVSKVQGSIN
jgi:hypothetical protein